MTKPHLFPTAQLPSWMFTAAKDGCVNVKELCCIYDVSKSTVKRWVATGVFPQPDMVVHGFAQPWVKDAFRWRISTVINFAKEHNDH